MKINTKLETKYGEKKDEMNRMWQYEVRIREQKKNVKLNKFSCANRIECECECEWITGVTKIQTITFN